MELINQLLGGNNLIILVVLLMFMFLRGTDTANPLINMLITLVRSVLLVPDPAKPVVEDDAIIESIIDILGKPEDQPVKELLKLLLRRARK